MSVNLHSRNENVQLTERQALPDRYLGLPEAEMDVRISAARAALGEMRGKTKIKAFACGSTCHILAAIMELVML